MSAVSIITAIIALMMEPANTSEWLAIFLITWLYNPEHCRPYIRR